MYTLLCTQILFLKEKYIKINKNMQKKVKSDIFQIQVVLHF